MNVLRASCVALMASALPAHGARAQASADARWQPWLGCWATVQADSAAPQAALCVIPAAGVSAVDLVQVADLRVVGRSHLDADGERHAATHDACTGWERAEWSPDGRRLLLRAEYDCAGEPHRVTTAVMAMVSGSQWVSVEGADAGDEPSVRVQRFDAAPGDFALPEEVVTALGDPAADRGAARLAAAAPVGPAEVINVAGRVEPIVLDAWLSTATGVDHFNGRQLVQLADGGVPPATIDLLVALANPRVFVVTAEAPRPEGIGAGGSFASAFAYAPLSSRSRNINLADSLYACESYSGQFVPTVDDYRYSRGTCRNYPFGRGAGWYRGQPTVQFVAPGPLGGSSSSTPVNGRAINGRGYTAGSNSEGRSARAAPREQTGTTAGSGNGSGSGGAASGAGSSTSTSTSTGNTGRTAQPRPKP